MKQGGQQEVEERKMNSQHLYLLTLSDRDSRLKMHIVIKWSYPLILSSCLEDSCEADFQWCHASRLGFQGLCSDVMTSSCSEDQFVKEPRGLFFWSNRRWIICFSVLLDNLWIYSLNCFGHIYMIGEQHIWLHLNTEGEIKEKSKTTTRYLF